MLRKLSPGQVGELMHLSDPLSVLNVGRYASWKPDHADGYQAMMAFNGDVYGGLDARSLAPAAIDFAQRHLRILSGLYGLLRPLDLIHPYRLEMGTRLATTARQQPVRVLGRHDHQGAEQAARGHASRRRWSTWLPKNTSSRSSRRCSKAPVITPVFEDWKNGKYKIISFYAKRARGMMARFAIENGITDAEALKDFEVDGYAFVPAGSTETSWLFRRKVADMKQRGVGTVSTPHRIYA